MFILHLRKMKLREVNCLLQGHTARAVRLDLTTGPSDIKLVFSPSGPG